MNAQTPIEPYRVIPSEVIAVVRKHQDITEVFRLMKERLGLTNKFIDNCGMIEGHTDKILGPSESKNWGPTTFDLFCEIFAIEFRVHVDLEAAKRMEAIWEGRERPLYPDSKTTRISKKLIERAKPHVLKDFAQLGVAARRVLCTGAEQTKKARRARLRLPKSKRSEISRKGWETRRKNREGKMPSLPKETQNQDDERVRQDWREGAQRLSISP